jgi:hypothetical protein
MDANSAQPWPEMDNTDLAHSLAYGNTSRTLRACYAETSLKSAKRRRSLGWSSIQASGGLCASSDKKSPAVRRG